jgi:MPBQ/MSBQ methyltransferase
MKFLALFSSLTAVSAFAPAHVQNRASTELAMGLKTVVAQSVSKIGAPATAAIAGAAVAGTIFGVKVVLDRPSRKYEEGSVAREYDAWTQDGILEYYWGEHIHLGYYNKEE